MLLQHDLERCAQDQPFKEALVAGATRLTYAELDDRANRLARALLRRGVARGDRVAIFLENCAEAVIAVWAALKADAVFMVVSPQVKVDKLSYVLEDSRATALVTHAALAEVAGAAAARSRHLSCVVVAGDGPLGPLDEQWGVLQWEEALDAEEAGAPRPRNIDLDLASIVYTSGSTGEPKGVMLTHRNMITAGASISRYLGLTEDDTILSVLPLAFDYGLYQALLAARAGARLVLERGFAYPAAVLDRLVTERATFFPGVPTLFAMLSAMKGIEAFDLSSVRAVTNTAAALSEAHVRALRRTFPGAKIFSMYGLTECKRCTYLPPEDLERKPASVGIAIPNTELWLVDEHGDRVPPGRVGELVIRGGTVMRGYWEKPEATARRLRPGPLPGEMVLYTGDLCRMDEEGYLYFVARKDEVIKSRGEKVSPVEVENALYALPGVREAAVIGVPDPVLGAAVKAFLVIDPPGRYGPREVILHCQERLEPHMVPKQVEFRDELPRTATGKIAKTELV